MPCDGAVNLRRLTDRREVEAWPIFMLQRARKDFPEIMPPAVREYLDWHPDLDPDKWIVSYELNGQTNILIQTLHEIQTRYGAL